MTTRDFDIDRVMAIWPRLHGCLILRVRNPIQAYEIIRLMEKGLGRGLTIATTLKSDRRISVLSKAAQRHLVAAAKEDVLGQAAGSGDLLGSFLSRTLDDLLQEIRSGDPHAATTAFEAGEDIRPAFRSVGHIFVSRHAESTNAHVVNVVERLEMRGLDCWYASRNVLSDWHGETLEAAETCGEGLLLLTREAASAPYVSAEAKIIIGAGRRMLTLVMEPGVRPRDVNMALENWQHHNWYQNPDAAMEALIAAIEA
jgi:hypothetical protein